MHHTINRLLKRMNLDGTIPPPDSEIWMDFLERVSRTLDNTDQDRYLLERSLAISSREMQELYEQLRLSSEQELNHVHEKVRSHVENSPLGVVELDDTFRILRWSPQAEKLFGWNEEEVLGKCFQEFPWIHEEDAEKVGWVMAHLLTESEPRCVNNCRNRRRDGSLAYCEWYNSALFDNEGRLISILSLIQDVTERYLAEQELMQAKEAAEEANRAKSAFLANMSHEIRTPMTAILGYTDVLDDPTLSRRDQHEYLSVIRRNGQHLLTLISDILDLSKIEAGRMDMEPVQAPLWQLVNEVIAMMRVRAVEKGLHLASEFVFPIPETVMTDPGRLRQILVNLIGNAIKFTEEGGVRLLVRVDTNWSSPCVSFEIIDTGIGMTQEQVDKLFQPFTQADVSTTRKFGGTGLGLTVSKNLVRMLGGSITVQSEPGRGSSFMVTINPGSFNDVRMIENVHEAGQSEEEAGSEQALGKLDHLTGRILLAEDGADNQRLISFLLKKAGFEVETAANGRIAVDMARAALDKDAPYDVILMDMLMPVMDGYAATQTLRKSGYKGPIIALTANAMSHDREKCIEAGCDDYTTKPIHRLNLLNLIRQYQSQVAPV